MHSSELSLIIKSPSDKVPSQVVNYELSWSVRDLKDHLCETYHTHPPPHTQRLIYAGKLLTDETLLSTLFKNSSVGRTIHLVCRNPETTENSSGTVSTSTPASASNSIDNIPESEMQQYQREYYEYLQRFYMENDDSPSGRDGQGGFAPWTYACLYPSQGPTWPFVSSWGSPATQYSPYFYYPVNPPAGNLYSFTPMVNQAESDTVMQPNLISNAANSNLTDLNALNQGNGDRAPAPGEREPVAGNGAVQQPQQQQAMMIGNPIAGGLMGAEEFGENAGNLDIIDRFYMIFRLSLFIGLCFAYSSLDKAIIVFAVAAYVYFYNVYRRHAALRRAAAAPVAPAAVPERPVAPSSSVQSDNGSTVDSTTAQHERHTVDNPEQQVCERSVNTTQSEPLPRESVQPVRLEPRLTRIAGTFRLVLSISFQFFSSLITSLIPEQPPPIRLD